MMYQTQCSDYADFLRGEERSPNTITKYTYDMKVFLRFLGDRPLSKEEVVSFKTYLLTMKVYYGWVANSGFYDALGSMSFPATVSKENISHTSFGLSHTMPVVAIRYDSGDVVVVNYSTGNAIYTVSTAGIASYANTLLANTLSGISSFSFSGTDSSYTDSTETLDQLSQDDVNTVLSSTSTDEDGNTESGDGVTMVTSPMW